jgi:hypothetical protein
MDILEENSISLDYTYIPGIGCRLAADDSNLQLTALLKIL